MEQEVLNDMKEKSGSERTPQDIVRLVSHYLPPVKGEIFFRVSAPIKQSETGKFALQVSHQEKDIDRDVFSRGVIIDTGSGINRIVYEHSHRMENGYDYRTILGRKLDDLTSKELDSVYNKMFEGLSRKGSLMPVIMTEGYDEEIGAEEHAYWCVTVPKPFDEEQGDIAEDHMVELVRDYTEKTDYIFMDWDDAVRFAHDDIYALDRRNDHRLDFDDSAEERFVVTVESSNRYLCDIARHHGGSAVLSKTGRPLVRSRFKGIKGAKMFRDDVRNLQRRAVTAVVQRTTDPRAKAMTDIQKAYVGAFLMSGGAKALKEASGQLQTLWDMAGKEPSFQKTSTAWKDDVFSELKDFLNGKERVTQSVVMKR